MGRDCKRDEFCLRKDKRAPPFYRRPLQLNEERFLCGVAIS